LLTKYLRFIFADLTKGQINNDSFF